MTQHDHKPEHSPGTSSATAFTTPSDDVTREQGGQFYEESGDFSGLPEVGIEADQEATIREGGVDSVNALQVNLDRSGAEYIHAQKAFLTNSGVRSIEGESSKLTNSGVLQLRAGSATLHQSSAVLVTADHLESGHGSILVSATEKAVINEGANVGMLQAANVESSGDIRAFALVGGNVKAGGNIESTMDSTTAAVFGAVFGAVFALVWKMIRRG